LSDLQLLPTFDFCSFALYCLLYIQCWAGAELNVKDIDEHDLNFMTITVSTETDKRKLCLMLKSMDERDETLMGIKNLVAMSNMIAPTSSSSYTGFPGDDQFYEFVSLANDMMAPAIGQSASSAADSEGDDIYGCYPEVSSVVPMGGQSLGRESIGGLPISEVKSLNMANPMINAGRASLLPLGVAKKPSVLMHNMMVNKAAVAAKVEPEKRPSMNGMPMAGVFTGGENGDGGMYMNPMMARKHKK